jgi:hypothetical protein
MDLATFGIGIGLNVGSSLLGWLFGANKQKPWTQREINRLETFDEPQSRYGEVIPRCYGKVRVNGIYAAAQVPFDWERDDYRNGQTREYELTYIYYGNLAVIWAMKPRISSSPEIKRIFFNKRTYYANGQVDGLLGQYWGRFEGLTVNNYYGDQTTNDPILSFLGDKHTAFKNTVYSSMKRLRLNNSDGKLFDFRYPNLEAEFHTHNGTLYLSAVVADLLDGAGYAPEEYDVTELADVSCLGFIAEVDSLANKLEQLQTAYFFEIVDTGAQLKFIKQFRPSRVATINYGDLGGSDDDKSGDLFTEYEEDLTSLPTSVRILYNNYGDNYQPASKESFKIKLGDWENVEEVATTLTLSEADALNIVNKQLLLAWTRRKRYKFSILPRFQYLEAGDVIDVEFREGVEPTQVQIAKLNQSASGLIEIEGVGYDGTIFDFGYTAPADNTANSAITQGTSIPLGGEAIIVTSVTSPDGSITYTEGVDYTVDLANGTVTPIIGGGIPTGSSVVINWQGDQVIQPFEVGNSPPTTLSGLNIVRPSPTETFGLYLLADGDSPWQSAVLWSSADGTNYTNLGPIYRGVFGTCATTLPDGDGVDNVSSLTVVVSETMDVPASGRILVGAEILDYSSASLSETTAISKTYVLSQFTRALQGTDGTGHGADEYFALLSGYKFIFPIEGEDIGSTFTFKAVSAGQALGDVSPTPITVTYFPPEITDVSPRQGDVGDAFTIYGRGFTSATSAAIATVDIDNFTVVDDTTITGNIAAGTTTGTITVTIPSETTTSLIEFKIVDSTVVWGDITGTLSSQTDLQAALDSKIEAIPFGGFIETIADKTYPLFKPDRNYMLKSLRVKSDSGTCTWAVQIGGVDVTGLSAVSVSSVEQLVSATGANTINAGSRVTIVSTNNSSAVDVEFTIMLEAV